MPSGQWEAFVAQVRSNRTVTFEQVASPHMRAVISHGDLIGVVESAVRDERVVKLRTRHKVLELKVASTDVDALRLRLQELIRTRDRVLRSGWMHKESLPENGPLPIRPPRASWTRKARPMVQWPRAATRGIGLNSMAVVS